MYGIRHRADRGKSENQWLNSFHTFSFADYYDPNYMGFSDLRVINDDYVVPGMGFGTHPHNDMEIVSIVLEGALEHKDSMGNGTVIRPGEIQKMTAGTGITHSEFNPSDKEPVHFLQIWLFPDQKNLTPSYQQKYFDEKETLNKLRLVVSPDGRDDSITIRQDAELYETVLEKDAAVIYEMQNDRKIWIHIALGRVAVKGEELKAGDGMALVEETGPLEITGLDEESTVILFNLKSQLS